MEDSHVRHGQAMFLVVIIRSGSIIVYLKNLTGDVRRIFGGPD